MKKSANKVILELRNVYKIYGMDHTTIVPAVNGVSLKINQGEFVSIMGPSGSGKSTLMHIMGCLDTPTKGKVFINGIDASKMSEDALARLRASEIGFVFQSFNLLPRLTALENVVLPMNFSNKIKDKENRALKLLSEMGLEKRTGHKPTELSGGQRQRVSIARALANDPNIILADEPTGNLDSKSGKDVMKILIELNKKFGKTLILVTHDRSLANLAQRIVSLKDGKIINERRLRK